MQANGRILALESEHETLVQNLEAMKGETGQLMIELEEERAANAQSQMSLAQLLGEFSSSVSAAEEAAIALTASQQLSESIASILSGLDIALAQAKNQARQDGDEQLRIVGLEMDLEEKSKAAADAAEECERLSSIVKQLEGEKEELESKVSSRTHTVQGLFIFTRCSLFAASFHESSVLCERASHSCLQFFLLLCS